MFKEACSRIRNAVYGVAGTWQPDGLPVTFTNGTAFMIAPGVLITTAHLVHIGADLAQPVLSLFEAIRAPDIGHRLEEAELIAEDPVRDMALLRIPNSRSELSVRLLADRVPLGTSCGSLGFPLATIRLTGADKVFHLVERFQGMFISAFPTRVDAYGREVAYYETDVLMYKGSAGCPGFLTNANVFGMHTQSILGPIEQVAVPGGTQVQAEAPLAVSAWVPAADIITFAHESEIDV